MRRIAPTALLLLLAARAWAGETPVALEVYAGAPPEDARYYVDYLLRTMGQEAPLHGAELRQRIESNLSHSPGTSEQPKNIRHLVEDGRRLFIEGQFMDAAAELEQARETLMNKVALVASDQTLRDALHKALLMLAHSYLRLKQPDRATEMISQVVRSFPDRDLSMVRYGPDLVSFYKKVRREMDRQPRGTLAVSTRPEKCLVFVNERFIGLSPTRVVDLYPGRYRIYIQRPKERGRIHVANVNGGDHQISIDFELDRVLRTEPFVGLQFRDRAMMERDEARYAAAVARGVESPMAVVLGFRRYQGRRMLQGTTVSADTGRPIRTGMVALEPAAPSPDTIKALGLFLVSGKPGSGVIVGGGEGGSVPASGGVAPADRAGGPGFFSARVFKWVTLGLAVAGLASGITLIALDGTGTCDAPEGGLCPQSYETMVPGAVLTAAGGAAAVGSGLLFWWDARGTRREVALLPWAGPRLAGLGARLSF